MHVDLIATANRADDRYGSSVHTAWVKPDPSASARIRLLRADSERPCRHRADDQRDELASFQLTESHLQPPKAGQ